MTRRAEVLFAGVWTVIWLGFGALIGSWLGPVSGLLWMAVTGIVLLLIWMEASRI